MRGSSWLRAELSGTTPIRYREFGSRALEPSRSLRVLTRRLQLAGITRVANISFLAANGFSVWQTTRPPLLGHAFLGQNTGAQGRGERAELARIGAIMETLEMHSAEARLPQVLRGSYEFLRSVHPILPPGAFTRGGGAAAGGEPGPDEPLLWTAAWSVQQQVDVLIPAECVYYALNARDYSTRPLFPQTTNGLAGGNTLVEASLHALYELVERHYGASWQSNARGLTTGRVRSEELHSLPSYRALLEQHPGTTAAVFAVRFRSAPALTCMLAVVAEGGATFYRGSACSFDPAQAVVRALGEALQSRAIQYSGSREDIAFRTRPPEGLDLKNWLLRIPETVTLEELGSADAAHDSLQEEFAALSAHVLRLGFRNILIRNLTRVGLEVPMVRVVVPGMKMQAFCRTSAWTAADRVRCQYSTDL